MILPVAVWLLSMGAPAHAAQITAENPVGSPAAVAVAFQAAEEPQTDGRPATSGLPARASASVPLTMSNYWPVFVGFALTWIGIVVYVLRLGGAGRRLGEGLERAEASAMSGPAGDGPAKV